MLASATQPGAPAELEPARRRPIRQSATSQSPCRPAPTPPRLPTRAAARCAPPAGRGRDRRCRYRRSPHRASRCCRAATRGMQSPAPARTARQQRDRPGARPEEQPPADRPIEAGEQRIRARSRRDSQAHQPRDARYRERSAALRPRPVLRAAAAKIKPAAISWHYFCDNRVKGMSSSASHRNILMRLPPFSPALTLASIAMPALADDTPSFFISPMGEPFRPGTTRPHIWFDQADTLTMTACSRSGRDGGRCGALLPRRSTEIKDGEIDPDEIEIYETQIAPMISVSAAPPRSVVELRRLGRPAKKPVYRASQGAARFGYFNYPEPVIVADTNFDRGVDARRIPHRCRQALRDARQKWRRQAGEVRAAQALAARLRTERGSAAAAGAAWAGMAAAGVGGGGMGGMSPGGMGSGGMGSGGMGPGGMGPGGMSPGGMGE